MLARPRQIRKADVAKELAFVKAEFAEYCAWAHFHAARVLKIKHFGSLQDIL